MLNRENEIWKDIPKFEERYQVSNLGRIRSIQDNHGKYREQIRATWISNKGYEYVKLFIKDKGHNISVHHAVATAFIPNPENKLTVNHKDGVKQNNILTNLEWATYSENMKHAYKMGLMTVQTPGKGKKWGNTSKYHNVTYDSSRNRWIASVKYQGKSHSKSFTIAKYGEQAEFLAAKAVNDLLDRFCITDRTKNIFF